MLDRRAAAGSMALTGDGRGDRTQERHAESRVGGSGGRRDVGDDPETVAVEALA